MNTHLYPVSFRKYSLILIYSFLALIVIDGCMEFYFEKLYGDLTRIGYFTERDFGIRSPQKVIPFELLKEYSLAEAEILVIGDSFSENHIWQTRLVADGLKVATIHWKDLKSPHVEGLLPDKLGETLRTSGFKGRYVIIESVERLFQLRMQALSAEYNPIVKHNNTVINVAPFTNRERISMSNLNGANWNIEALSNTIKLSLMPSNYLKSMKVYAIKFDGCQLFSNRLCNYSLFIDEDFEKKTFDSINNVLAVNEHLRAVGIQSIWLVIPDKSTIYLGYGKLNKYPYENIWNTFAQYPEIIAPNLGVIFTRKSRTVTDFYMPDNTHLSASGFLYLGDIVLSGLHQLVGWDDVRYPSSTLTKHLDSYFVPAYLLSTSNTRNNKGVLK